MKFRFLCKDIVTSLILVLGISGLAHADMFSVWQRNDMMNMIFRPQINKMVKDQQQGKPATPSKKPADFRLTDFTASRRTVADQFVKDAQGLSAEQRKELLKSLKDGMIELEKALPRKNNVAYAMAALIGTAITVAKGVDVPGDEIEKLAAGFNDILGTTPEWKKTSAAQKQILYESTLLNIVLMMMESQAEDQETKDIAVKTAKSVLASFGADK